MTHYTKHVIMQSEVYRIHLVSQPTESCGRTLPERVRNLPIAIIISMSAYMAHVNPFPNLTF